MHEQNVLALKKSSFLEYLLNLDALPLINSRNAEILFDASCCLYEDYQYR